MGKVIDPFYLPKIGNVSQSHLIGQGGAFHFISVTVTLLLDAIQVETVYRVINLIPSPCSDNSLDAVH